MLHNNAVAISFCIASLYSIKGQLVLISVASINGLLVYVKKYNYGK